MRRFHVVPHTHWDREWYWPFERFRLELGRVVDGVLDTLEADSAFRSFTLDGQAIVLEDYVEVRPENEGRLRALIADGRIEVGPSYVLPDELLVGGEALVRNLLLGRTVCERFGARPSAAGYLPDSFGHPLQLPQILAGFGIDTFLFSRGMGDEVDEIGIVFRWRAPDGSEVLAVQLQGDYSNFAAIRDVDHASERVTSIVERFGPALDRAGVRDVVLCNGSDHLSVQPEMPGLCRELEERFPGERFAISRYDDYARAIAGADVPAWSGELLGSRLWNVLRGVNSARLYLKQANERAERRLLSVETLSALVALRDGTPFALADFRLAWRDLLRCQPHDSICGCSCDEVHRDMLVRYESLDRTVAALLGRALPSAGDAATRIATVFNPLPQRRAGLVEAAGAAPAFIELDGFAVATVALAPARDDAASEGTTIESDVLRVEAAPDGTIAVTELASGRRLTGLHRLEDEPDVGDLYNFCPVDGAPTWRSERASARVLADGPLVWELEITYAASEIGLGVATIVRLVRGGGRVECRTLVDNAAPDHRLRVVFGLGAVDAGPVRAEGQFAVVHRPVEGPRPATEWCEPPDPTQHTLGAVALGPLALLTKGLPEYEARDASELCLTLLRCVGLISRDSGEIATRPLGAGPRVATPEGQCLGRHELEYALRLDADALDDTALLREGQDYRYGFPPVGTDPAHPAELAAPIGLEGDVVFSCLKGAENGDGFILRCVNVASAPATARVTGPVAASRVRLDETADEPLPDGAFTARPGEIVTLRLRRA